MDERDWFTPLQATIRALLDLLAAVQIRGVVIGGVAASALGEARFTHDVDATAELESDQLQSFLATAAEFGFEPRRADAVPFAKRARIVLLHHVPSDLDVDLAIASLPFEFEMIQRAWRARLGDMVVPLASPEDLVITKAVAKRDQDLEDIREILNSHPDLDIERARLYLPQFAEALDDPSIITTFEKLVTEWREQQANDARLLSSDS